MSMASPEEYAERLKAMKKISPSVWRE